MRPENWPLDLAKVNANGLERSGRWSGEDKGITGIGREKVVRTWRRSCGQSLNEQQRGEPRDDSTPIGSPSKSYSL